MRADICRKECVRTRHVIIGTLPCVSITSVNEDANMAISAESDTLRLMGSTVKSQSKVVGKDQLSY